MPNRPSIADFTDYRKFMQAMIVYLKGAHGATYKTLAAAAGFKSRAFIKQVASGLRSPSDRSVPKIAKALRLNERELRLFQALVALDKANTDAERHERYLALASLSNSPSVRLAKLEYEIYSSWEAVVLREMVGMDDFREDAAWLARRLRVPIRASAVDTLLRRLTKLGLLERDVETGQLQPKERSVDTPPQVKSLSVRNFHRRALELAIDALDGVPVDSRNVTSVVLPLTRDQYEWYCERLTELRRELVRRWQRELDETNGEPREVYQLCLALFPATEETKT